jgi:hypothetical protein
VTGTINTMAGWIGTIGNANWVIEDSDVGGIVYDDSANPSATGVVKLFANNVRFGNFISRVGALNRFQYCTFHSTGSACIVDLYSSGAQFLNSVFIADAGQDSIDTVTPGTIISYGNLANSNVGAGVTASSGSLPTVDAALT